MIIDLHEDMLSPPERREGKGDDNTGVLYVRKECSGWVSSSRRKRCEREKTDRHHITEGEGPKGNHTHKERDVHSKYSQSRTILHSHLLVLVWYDHKLLDPEKLDLILDRLDGHLRRR